MGRARRWQSCRGVPRRRRRSLSRRRAFVGDHDRRFRGGRPAPRSLATTMSPFALVPVETFAFGRQIGRQHLPVRPPRRKAPAGGGGAGGARQARTPRATEGSRGWTAVRRSRVRSLRERGRYARACWLRRRGGVEPRRVGFAGECASSWRRVAFAAGLQRAGQLLGPGEGHGVVASWSGRLAAVASGWRFPGPKKATLPEPPARFDGAAVDILRCRRSDPTADVGLRHGDETVQWRAS